MQINKKIPFILAVVLQMVLLLLIPLPIWLTSLYGKTVFLETVPVDPYSVFSGYYIRLNYQISNLRNFPPTIYSTKLYDNNYYYVVLAPDVSGKWQPQRITSLLPTDLDRNEVALRGRYCYNSFDYGIEQYYLPEAKRTELDGYLRNHELVVEAKVGPSGNASIVKFWVGNQSFAY